MINFLAKLLKNEHFSAIINEKQKSLIATKRIMEENQMGNYSALDVAKYIINKCSKDKCPISNLQLQKILYYIQKDYLNHDMTAFSDAIEAWQFGPVVPNVYYHYCGFGAMPIDVMDEESLIDQEDSIEFNQIIESKRILDPWDMVTETHKKAGAWDRVYQNGIGNHKIIPNALIKAAG